MRIYFEIMNIGIFHHRGWQKEMPSHKEGVILFTQKLLKLYYVCSAFSFPLHLSTLVDSKAMPEGLYL